MTAARGSAIAQAMGIVAVVSAVLIAAAPANSQTLGRRIADAPDGKVRLQFAAKPDVCGHGSYISRGKNSTMNWDSDRSEDVEYTEDCALSPVRLVLEKQGGQVARLRTYVGGRWRAPSGTVTDLGSVSTRDATDYLVSLIYAAPVQPAREAIFPLTLADSVVIWPALMKIARDQSRPTGIRTQSVFWLSQIAGDVVTANLAALTGEAAVDREIRKQAVFALSQRRNDEGVTALIQVARTNRDPEIRKNALFWLGQSHDPRALVLFEEILSRR
jgi:hypothetical protein